MVWGMHTGCRVARHAQRTDIVSSIMASVSLVPPVVLGLLLPGYQLIFEKLSKEDKYYNQDGNLFHIGLYYQLAAFVISYSFLARCLALHGLRGSLFLEVKERKSSFPHPALFITPTTAPRTSSAWSCALHSLLRAALHSSRSTLALTLTITADGSRSRGSTTPTTTRPRAAAASPPLPRRRTATRAR